MTSEPEIPRADQPRFFYLDRERIIEEARNLGYKFFVYYNRRILAGGESEEDVLGSLPPEKRKLPFICVDLEGRVREDTDECVGCGFEEE